MAKGSMMETIDVLIKDKRINNSDLATALGWIKEEIQERAKSIGVYDD